ncbi:hypothetical protein [Achromobacter insuavis]|uniref:hypothetical protein n=1 Tax=Achromobacter insuavis TaxID=1287735 RepID=UPI0012F5123C|nr:hypothetical protein [Achromobacter insuavis]
MLTFIKQAVRGCGALPHVGEHPGKFWLAVFVLMGALAGANGGWGGALAGALIMLLGMGVPFFMGAYDRAEASDRAAQQAEQGAGR